MGGVAAAGCGSRADHTLRADRCEALAWGGTRLGNRLFSIAASVVDGKGVFVVRQFVRHGAFPNRLNFVIGKRIDERRGQRFAKLIKLKSGQTRKVGIAKVGIALLLKENVVESIVPPFKGEDQRAVIAARPDLSIAKARKSPMNPGSKKDFVFLNDLGTLRKRLSTAERRQELLRIHENMTMIPAKIDRVDYYTVPNAKSKGCVNNECAFILP